MAETSNSRLTFSLTSTPPASRAAFQLTPQSLRLTLVVPSRPMRVLLYGSTALPLYSKSTVTGLVTPLMVRSPVTRYSVSPVCSTAVEANVISGYVSQIDKSRSEEHTSELQSLMRISYAVFCLKKKKHKITI